MNEKKSINISTISNKYGNKVANNVKKIAGKTNLYPNEEFFPYACYFDKRTILTQNGELLQIIKIPSFVKNNSSNALFKLRADLQNAIKTYACDTNINFWFNTVRKAVDIIPKNHEYKDDFSRYINYSWNKYNNFDKQYANEIYITIILVDGKKKTGLFDNFVKNLFFRSLKKTTKSRLTKLCATLTKIVDNIANYLEKYNPHILEIINIEGNYFSEHCKLFSLIVNNDRKLFPLDINMLGYGLANHKMIFHSNRVTICDQEKTTYASLISIKDLNHLLLSELDKIIQLDQELIITQSASFLEKKSTYKSLIDSEIETLNLVDDTDIKELTKINELKDEIDKPDNVLNFTINQVLVQIKGHTLEELENHIKSLFEVLKEIGLIGVREEMFMPTLYWSQLPANFNFIKRLRVVPIDEIGQFVSLYNFPTGKLTKNTWGDAVSVLKTTINTPYFFSFHDANNNGNTLIVSPDCAYSTMLLNFLVTESSKLADKIYHIDFKNRSKVFVNTLNGNYYELSNTENSNKKKLSINPFVLDNTDENITFIIDWIDAILRTDDDGFIRIGNKKTNLEEEIKRFNYSIVKEIKNFKCLKDVYNFAIENSFVEVARILKKWCDNSTEGYGFIFNNNFTIDLKSGFITGINLGNTIFNDDVKYIILKYVLHQIYINLDKSKNTIIAVDEIWGMFDNKYLSGKFRDTIKKFSEKNAIFVATTSGSDFFDLSFIKQPVYDIFTTNIFLQNLKTSIYQKKIFGINEQESRLLSVIKPDSNIFLLKHNNNMVFSSVKFDFIDETEEKVFNADMVTINAMNTAKKITNSEDFAIWLPIMEEIIKRYNKYTYENRIKEQEKRQIEWQESREQISKVK